MNDVNLEELQRRYEAETPPPPPHVPYSQAVGYVHFKAYGFLTLGPERYRQIDALRMPPEHWAETKLAAVRAGCEQIVAWRGFTRDEPLRNIGIAGLHALMQMFHFDCVQQALVDQTPEGMLDAMHMRHIVDGQELLVFNLVSKPAQVTALCPFCGGALRTPRAKQCRHCGADWHT